MSARAWAIRRGVHLPLHPEPGTDLAPAVLPDVAQIGVRWVPLGALSAVTMWPETVQQLLVSWDEGGRPLVPAYLGDCP